MYDQFYRESFVTNKATGKKKAIAIPADWLKEKQHSLLHELRKLPCHNAAHGFRVGRNCRSALSVHRPEDYKVCLDISKFFRAIGPDQVVNCLRANSFSGKRASEIASLATFNGGLAIGSPISPVLANAVFYWLDTFFSNSYRYSRYADDMIFSLPLLDLSMDSDLSISWTYSEGECEMHNIGPMDNRKTIDKSNGLIVDISTQLEYYGYKLNRGKVKLNPMYILGLGARPENWLKPKGQKQK